MSGSAGPEVLPPLAPAGPHRPRGGHSGGHHVPRPATGRTRSEAFHQEHGLQCGYCTAGMVMAAVSLLDEEDGLTEAAVRNGLEGNLCRCTGYHNIVRAVLAAAGR